MYRAFNDYIIVKAVTDPNFQNQVLEGEVVATTKETEKLQGKFVYAQRGDFKQLSESEDDNTTETGIILGGKKVYCALDFNKVIAIKHE